MNISTNSLYIIHIVSDCIAQINAQESRSLWFHEEFKLSKIDKVTKDLNDK